MTPCTTRIFLGGRSCDGGQLSTVFLCDNDSEDSLISSHCHRMSQIWVLAWQQSQHESWARLILFTVRIFLFRAAVFPAQCAYIGGLLAYSGICPTHTQTHTHTVHTEGGSDLVFLNSTNCWGLWEMDAITCCRSMKSMHVGLNEHHKIILDSLCGKQIFRRSVMVRLKVEMLIWNQPFDCEIW